MILTKPETKFAEDLINECDRLMEQLKEQKIEDDDDSPNQLLTLGQMKEKILDLSYPMRQKLFEKIRITLESINNSSTPHSSTPGDSSESNNNEETKTQVLTLLLELANKKYDNDGT